MIINTVSHYETNKIHMLRIPNGGKRKNYDDVVNNDVEKPVDWGGR